MFSFLMIPPVVLSFAGSAFALETNATGTCWPMWQHGPEHNGRTPYAGSDIPSFLWKFPFNGTCETGLTVGPGGNLYFGSNLGNIYSITPRGKFRWSYSTQGAIRGQPLIDGDGVLYLGSFDRHMYAIDIETGSSLWLFNTGFSVASSPAIDKDGNIYFGCHDRNVYCLYPDGVLKWSLETQGPISVSSPTLTEDGFLYICGYSSGLVKVRCSDGENIWRFFPIGIDALRNTAALGSDGTVFIGSRNGVFFAVAPDGQEKWRFQAGGEIRSSAAIGPDGSVYFGCHDSNLYSLDSETGDLNWVSFAGGPVDGSPCVDANNIVYVGGAGGRFRAFYPDGTLKFEFGPKVINGCVSVDADGTLYAGGEYGVYAYGWPLPEVHLEVNREELTGSEELVVDLRISNPGPFEKSADVKVWKRGPVGEPSGLYEEKALLMEAGHLDTMEVYTHVFGEQDTEGGYFFGARLLHADSGNILSESKVLVNFGRDKEEEALPEE